MPFKYTNAPILAYNDGRSDFPLVEKFARQSARSTIEGGLSSRLRSLVRPLQVELAREVIAMYQRKRAAAAPSAFASTYVEALPSKPPKMDLHREKTYKARIRKLKGTAKDGRWGKEC